jgi:integrase
MPTPKTIPKSKFIQVGQNLQRYVPTGTYYARIRVAGKLHKKSLGTTVLTIAKLKLGDFAKQLHTLRHLFITTCLESGVKIHTLAHWVGHGDGGALLLQRYGRLRPEHSLEDAAKVTFGQA